jgi:hypothetical protein
MMQVFTLTRLWIYLHPIKEVVKLVSSVVQVLAKLSLLWS